ncbi:hypothetical protein ACIP98_21085 [Streptomyces sp. NPDC088354]|uniref:hypothetical protein n=1 Tax=Streptomyces sp. NPDC088354 TaxID=3365856 RepID=UPI00381D6F40
MPGVLAPGARATAALLKPLAGRGWQILTENTTPTDKGRVRVVLLAAAAELKDAQFERRAWTA